MYLSALSDLMKLELSRVFFLNPNISTVMKIRPLAAELLHADGQTDRHDEADGRFSQFCESAQNANDMR
jgi:hypothetical protein